MQDFIIGTEIDGKMNMELLDKINELTIKVLNNEK